MKVLVVFVAACIALSQCLSEEMIKQITALKEQCMKESGVAEEILVKMKAGEFTEDSKAKEFTFCFLNNAGFMSDDGVVDKDFMKTAMTEEFGEERANKVVQACADKAGSTPQDTSYLLSKCFFENKPHA